jgi:hypothetical protein
MNEIDISIGFYEPLYSLEEKKNEPLYSYSFSVFLFIILLIFSHFYFSIKKRKFSDENVLAKKQATSFPP